MASLENTIENNMKSFATLSKNQKLIFERDKIVKLTDKHEPLAKWENDRLLERHQQKLSEITSKGSKTQRSNRSGEEILKRANHYHQIGYDFRKKESDMQRKKENKRFLLKLFEI